MKHKLNVTIARTHLAAAGYLRSVRRSGVFKDWN